MPACLLEQLDVDLTTRAGRKEQGKRIQQAAQDVGLTLEDLANEIGCSRALIYQYASGGVVAQPARLQKIAQRTGRSMAFFYEDSLQSTGDVPAAQEENVVLSLSEPPSRDEVGRRRSGERDEPLMDLAGSGVEVDDMMSPGARPRSAFPEAAPGAVLNLSPSSATARIALPYLEELADALETCGDSHGLVSACERIVPFARELGDRESEARAWLRIGNARVERDFHDPALPALRVALSLFNEIGNGRMALSCRQSIGRALVGLGESEAAMTEFQQVAQGPSWANRWQGTVSIAALHEQAGNFQAALEYCEEALRIVGSEPGVSPHLVETARSYIISNQANVYLSCGDFTHADRISRDLLLTAERANQRDQFVEALINLGISALYRGEWDNSEEQFDRAIEVARLLEDRPRWSLAKAWKASLLCLMGDGELAKDEAKAALHVGLKAASRRCEVHAQIALGEAYLSTGAPRESLYHFGEAIEVAAGCSNVLQQSLALLRRAAANHALYDTASAQTDTVSALEIAQERGIQHVEAMARQQLALMEMQSDNLELSLDLAMAAERAAERLGIILTRLMSQALQARLYDARGMRDDAIKKGHAAIYLLQRLRERVLACHETESLLEDSALLEVVQLQVQRLTLGNQNAAASELVEETQWPPLMAWFESVSSNA